MKPTDYADKPVSIFAPLTDRKFIDRISGHFLECKAEVATILQADLASAKNTNKVEACKKRIQLFEARARSPFSLTKLLYDEILAWSGDKVI